VKQHHPQLQGPMAHALYRAFWEEGKDLSTPETVAAIDLPPGIDRATLAEATAGEEAASLLRNAVAASMKAGVFGSPTVVVDGEPFWGVDRLDEAEAWLAEGGW
jgi:2-hydroxychromene-2-carboxylate isomerase